MPSNTSLPKLGFNCGLMAPGGIKNCKELNSSNRSSGNPVGYGEILGVCKANGMPTPGMGGPLGTIGVGKEILFGLQGDIDYLYIRVIWFPLEE